MQLYQTIIWRIGRGNQQSIRDLEDSDYFHSYLIEAENNQKTADEHLRQQEQHNARVMDEELQ
jgi:hypothetical protein